MSNSEPCTLYFSHSWLSHDVDTNLALWETISGRCHVLIDDNREVNPPYYISRIEDYIRRCDVVLAVLLPAREGSGAPSDYSLFEIRLAERARKPSLILYESQTQFVPGAEGRRGMRYQEFNRDDFFRPGNPIRTVLTEWVDAIDGARRGGDIIDHQKAALLLPEEIRDGQGGEAIRRGLAAAGLTNVQDLTTLSNDVEIMSALRSSRLFVADVGSPGLWDVYGSAHALFIPTIRLFNQQSAELPPILQGHRAGYEEDLVRWSDEAELEQAVAGRALALRDAGVPITDLDTGRAIFERRR